MIKELVQFTTTALEDPVFRSFGVTPKEGLHIVLQVEKTEEQTIIAEKPVFTGIYNKKTEISDWLLRCTDWWKASTMLGVVDTFKVFDVPAKAIHTVSPFCLGVKRTNLEGGEQYAENHSKGKSQVYDRINAYFAKAIALLESPDDKIIADALRIALNDKTQLHRWLTESGHFNNIKDGEYVVFYLNLPLERYDVANRKYLKEKLFNTANYNIQDSTDPDILHGTSNWLNGFPTKKPFLMHQTATFDIAGRVSSKEAQLLYEFSDLSRRRLFPNPLPLFIMEDERERAFKIFKEDALSGEEKRKPYLEIISDLQRNHSGEVGNYYLLFQQAGEIRDFDYVSRFEFNLSPDGSAWTVQDLFSIGQEMALTTVNDLLTMALPPMFNNALVVRRKEKDWIFHWFDDIEPGYCKTHNAFLLAMKYRKAFYDFIYKSKRQGVTGEAIREILLTGILDDIRLDEFKNNRNSEGYNIRLKLNLLFSLYQYFSPSQPNVLFMPAKIEELRQHIDAVAKGEAHIEHDDQFAFAAGQMISRIFMQSETANRSFKYIEPFFRQTNIDKFKQGIQEFFLRYSHKNYAKRFSKVSAEVMSYSPNREFGELEKLRPVILAGVFFRRNLLLSEDEKTNEDETQVISEN